MILFRKKPQAFIILLFVIFVFSGSVYALYLHMVFPSLVPHHGGGERFTLTPVNNFTSFIPWSANTRLHLALQANDTVQLYIDGNDTCACTHYEMIVEAGGYSIMRLTSDAPVGGMVTAWQEIPFEQQLVTYAILVTGLIGVIRSIYLNRR